MSGLEWFAVVMAALILIVIVVITN